MDTSFLRVFFAAAALFAGCAVGRAQNYEPSPIGATFVITASQKAPWATNAFGEADARSRGLQGKTITFGAKTINGPQPMACRKPNYERVAVEPDALFQGGLKAPDKDAAALGLKPGNTPSLLTGCELDYHFIDADHALFALDNRIYRIERMKK